MYYNLNINNIYHSFIISQRLNQFGLNKFFLNFHFTIHVLFMLCFSIVILLFIRTICLSGILANSKKWWDSDHCYHQKWSVSDTVFRFYWQCQSSEWRQKYNIFILWVKNEAHSQADSVCHCIFMGKTMLLKKKSYIIEWRRNNKVKTRRTNYSQFSNSLQNNKIV